MNTRRFVLAALLLPLPLPLPFVTLSAQVQQQAGAAGEPSAATIAAKAKKAKLDVKHAKNASINGKKFNIVPTDLTGMTREQLAAGAVIGVLDNEAGAADDVSLPPGKFNIYLQQIGGQWQGYAEQNGKIYRPKRNSVRTDVAPGSEPQFSRGSGCWTIYVLFFPFYICF